jgi:hypothetical protein
MANILDYIKWRGDILFSEKGINEVDNLILAYLSYVELDGIIPGKYSANSISLEQANACFWQLHTEEEVLEAVNMTKMAALVMRAMAESPRYRSIRLSRYVNHIDEEEMTQFCAMCMELEENKTYVAFRGTDSTIVGWKEDFNMSFVTVPSQREAVDYLNFVGSLIPGKLWVGGHSKGGNLAVYSSVKAMDVIKDKIVLVYNNDGPGFNRSMIDTEQYKRIHDKIRTYVPKSSIIGMLLEHEEDYVIVDSSAAGIRQHDPMSWVVEGPAFVYEENRTSESMIFDAATRAWISGMSYEERAEFVDTLFGLLEEADIKILGDFTATKRQKLKDLFRLTRENAEGKQILKTAGKALLTEATKAVSKIITGK